MCNHHMHLRCFLAVARWLQVTASSIVGKKEAQSDKNAIAKPFKEAMLAQRHRRKIARERFEHQAALPNTQLTRLKRMPGNTSLIGTSKAHG